MCFVSFVCFDCLCLCVRVRLFVLCRPFVCLLVVVAVGVFAVGAVVCLFVCVCLCCVVCLFMCLSLVVVCRLSLSLTASKEDDTDKATQIDDACRSILVRVLAARVSLCLYPCIVVFLTSDRRTMSFAFGIHGTSHQTLRFA